MLSLDICTSFWEEKGSACENYYVFHAPSLPLFFLSSKFMSLPLLQVARFLSEEVRPLLEPYKAKMDVKIELEL